MKLKFIDKMFLLLLEDIKKYIYVILKLPILKKKENLDLSI